MPTKIRVMNQGRIARQCGQYMLVPNVWTEVPFEFITHYGVSRDLNYDFTGAADSLRTHTDEGNLSIDWRSPLSMVDGYGRHAIWLIRALQRAKVAVAVRDVGWVDNAWLPADIRSARALYHFAVPSKIGLAFTLGYDPQLFDHESLIKIGITQFETNTLPYKHVENINKLDHCVVTSSFQVAVFRRCGVKVPITVMTPGIEVDSFPYIERFKDGKFKVLVLGALTDRKNPLGAIRIFQAASRGNTDWRLTLKTRNAKGIEAVRREAAKDARIKLVVGDDDPDKVKDWYNSHDAFLWPCFSEDTKILSQDGFKTHEELQVGDSVLTVNPGTGVLEDDVVLNKWVKDYSGQMVHFKNNRLDALVTPNHRVYYRTPKVASLQVRQAGEFLGKGRTRYSMPVTARGTGYEADFVELNSLPPWRNKNHHSIKGLPDRVATDDLMRLFGWYISEGSTYRPKSRPLGLGVAERRVGFSGTRGVKVSIAQRDESNLREIATTLEAFGQVVSYQKNVLVANSVRLGELLEGCGKGALHKTIPNWILRFSPRHLQVLFDTLIKGDGSEKGNHLTYYTSSPQLRDKFIELCFRLGYAVKICDRAPVDRHIEGRFVGIKNTQTSYAIGVSRRYTSGTFSPYDDVSSRQYTGKVWCIETRNQTVVAMRNGAVFVSGNSKGEGVGLPPLEAMSTGMELVCSDNSGMSDYLDKRYCYTFKTAGLEPANGPGLFTDEYVRAHGDVGSWWTPDEKDGAKQLERCFNEWRSGGGKGKRAAKAVREKFSIDHSAADLIKVIQQYV